YARLGYVFGLSVRCQLWIPTKAAPVAVFVVISLREERRLPQGRRYPDPGGDWGLVALLVFKTSAPARVGGRVRFPSASAKRGLSRTNRFSYHAREVDCSAAHRSISDQFLINF